MFNACIRKIEGTMGMKKSELRQIIKEEIKSLLTESTRSRVGMLNPDGTITSIYVHYDGYIDGVGKTLKQHYKNPVLVKKMMSLGDASFLEPKLDPSGEHSFNNPEKGVTVFYGRDRGEKGVNTLKDRTLQGFLNTSHDSGADYMYLFDPKAKTWTVSKIGSKEFKKI